MRWKLVEEEKKKQQLRKDFAKLKVMVSRDEVFEWLELCGKREPTIWREWHRDEEYDPAQRRWRKLYPVEKLAQLGLEEERRQELRKKARRFRKLKRAAQRKGQSLAEFCHQKAQG